MSATVGISVKESKELKSIEGSKINFLSREYTVVKILEQKPGNVFVLKGEEGQPIEVSGDHMLHVPEKLAGQYKGRVEVGVSVEDVLAEVKKLAGRVSVLENRMKAPKAPPKDKPKTVAGGK